MSAEASMNFAQPVAGEQFSAEVRSLTSAAVAMLRGFESLRLRTAERENLGSTELRALARVAEAGEITPKQLAERLGLTTGAVTALADRLVRLQLLHRSAHPNDRRSLLLSLTAAGVTISDRMYDGFLGAVEEASRFMPAEDIHHLSAVLNATAIALAEVEEQSARSLAG